MEVQYLTIPLKIEITTEYQKEATFLIEFFLSLFIYTNQVLLH